METETYSKTKRLTNEKITERWFHMINKASGRRDKLYLEIANKIRESEILNVEISKSAEESPDKDIPLGQEIPPGRLRNTYKRFRLRQKFMVPGEGLEPSRRNSIGF